MSKFLNIPNGDYKVSVKEGGRITLDVGTDTGGGAVVITGDLIVQGEQTTLNTRNLDIEDNVIVLNKGETGPGITDADGYSGIVIDRGGLNAQFIYDETLTDPKGVASNADGLFRFRISGESDTTKGIWINSISTGGEDLLVNTGTGVISVSGTPNYENQVTDDDDITNKKYVDDAIDFAFATVFLPQIGAGSTSISRILITDQEDTGIESEISFEIDGTNIGSFYNNRFELGDIRITGTQIETIVSNEDLVLSSPGTSSVRIDDTLHINSVPGIDEDPLVAASFSPISPDDGAKIYVSNESTGRTGIYFVNSNETRDELVSKNRALLFGMIF